MEHMMQWLAVACGGSGGTATQLKVVLDPDIPHKGAGAMTYLNYKTEAHIVRPGDTSPSGTTWVPGGVPPGWGGGPLGVSVPGTNFILAKISGTYYAVPMASVRLWQHKMMTQYGASPEIFTPALALRSLFVNPNLELVGTNVAYPPNWTPDLSKAVSLTSFDQLLEAIARGGLNVVSPDYGAPYVPGSPTTPAGILYPQPPAGSTQPPVHSGVGDIQKWLPWIIGGAVLVGGGLFLAKRRRRR